MRCSVIRAPSPPIVFQGAVHTTTDAGEDHVSRHVKRENVFGVSVGWS